MKRKIFIYMLISMMFGSLTLSGCSLSKNAGNSSKTSAVSETDSEDNNSDDSDYVVTESFEVSPDLSNEELDDTFDKDECIVIELNDDAVSADKGVTVDGTKITITKGGNYYFTGTLSDGCIVVDSEDDEIVRLIFDDVDITSKDQSPLFIKQAEETIITLASDSENSFTDASEYTGSEVVTEDDSVEPNACIYSKDDLTINGSGSLTVNGNYNNGIQTKDDLIIVSGDITVNAAGSAIKGKDSVTVMDGNLVLDSTDDGIKSTRDNKDGKGYVYIGGGKINITTDEDGINSATCVVIDGGNLSISAGDDGIHGDISLTINGGNINVLESYEGLEATEITINDGRVLINASDDGMNATVGITDENEESDSGNNFKGGGMMDAEEGAILTINGGYVYVNASGDGLDTNGYMYINGGEIYVDGPTSNGDGSLDYGIDLKVTGGTVLSVGSMGMVEPPTSSSTQNCFVIGLSMSYGGGSTITIVDSDGNEILNFTPKKTFQSVIFSSSEIESGKTYTVLVDGEEDVEFTASDIITNAGESSGGMAGFGGRGGNMRENQGMNQ